MVWIRLLLVFSPATKSAAYVVWCFFANSRVYELPRGLDQAIHVLCGPAMASEVTVSTVCHFQGSTEFTFVLFMYI